MNKLSWNEQGLKSIVFMNLTTVVFTVGRYLQSWKIRYKVGTYYSWVPLPTPLQCRTNGTIRVGTFVLKPPSIKYLEVWSGKISQFFKLKVIPDVLKKKTLVIIIAWVTTGNIFKRMRASFPDPDSFDSRIRIRNTVWPDSS